MRGGRITRITSEEKSAISTYVGAGIAVLLAVVGIYFFFLTQKEKAETTTFDPNRPVPTDAVLKQRLKAVEFWIVPHSGTETPFQNQCLHNDKRAIYVDVMTGEPLFASVANSYAQIGLPTVIKL